MKILLISANPTIEKLFTLSTEKKGDDVIIGNREFVPEDNFEAVFLEKDLYDEEFLNSLKEKFKNAKFVLILSKKDEKLPGFDTYLTKPFLPTDLMDVLEKLPNIQNETKESFDIENFNEDLDLEEENFDLENTQKEEIDDFALDDIDELVEEGDEKPDFEELEELENLPEDEVLITEDELLEEAPDSDIEDTISISEEELQNLEDEDKEGEEVPSSCQVAKFQVRKNCRKSKQKKILTPKKMKIMKIWN
ncbi:response regulator transcription factor [Lebetimonas sp. JS138]|uniref:response regulator transcription factor n=1 Tax=Lebetimonas sp. JS138 TaxID=990072 RepID=UPI00046703A7|nr:response regulator transcription factor [Lebetimonas sp. JS138]